jgi:hypothetical protein
MERRMSSTHVVALLFCIIKTTVAVCADDNLGTGSRPRVFFMENKGQVSDQFGNPRPDILFSGINSALSFHMKKDGISYQMMTVTEWTTAVPIRPIVPAAVGKTAKEPCVVSVERIDIDWIGIRKDAVVNTGPALSGYDNFYNEACPNGAVYVKSFADVLYKNLYNGIDLHWLAGNGNLKYEYNVAAGADYTQIRSKVSGAQKLEIDRDGNLVIATSE